MTEETVPEPLPLDEVKTSTGIDMGYALLEIYIKQQQRIYFFAYCKDK
jgi:hypothetical protein